MNKNIEIPIIGSNISAGFPSPAGDYVEDNLDLNRYLVNHPHSTYYIRVSGESMKNAGIFDGDILIVDRAIAPQPNKIIIAELNGELTVKRFKQTEGQTYLHPENDNYKPIFIAPNDDFAIWGVVIGSFRKY